MKESIFLIIKSQLINRKKQSILTALSITTCTLVLCLGLAIVLEMQGPYDQMFEQQRASHLLLHFDRQTDSPSEIISWLSNQEQVSSHTNFTAHHTFGKKCTHKGREMDVLLTLTEHSDDYLQQDLLQIVDGSDGLHPGSGEVWLPVHLRKSHNIALGDTIVLPLQKGNYALEVGAFVIDPHYVSGLMNPTRVWVAQNELAMFLPVNSISGGSIGVRLKDASQIEEVWSKFNQENAYNGSHFKYHLFKGVFLSFFNLIGIVLLIFAILGICLTVLLLINNLRNVLLADYKQLGIYKAIGFSSRQIITAYCIQYGSIALLGIAIAVLMASGISGMISGLLSQSLGQVDTHLSIATAAQITSLVIVLIVLLCTIWQVRKIKNVAPNIAIREEQPVIQSSKLKATSLSHLNRLPLPAFIASRLLLSDKRRFLFSVLSMIGIISLLCFCINISNSFLQLQNNRSYWGFEEADVLISPGSRLMAKQNEQQFIKQLERQDEVACVTPFSFYSIDITSPSKEVEEIYGKVYGQNIDALGLPVLEGSNPIHEKELALCINTAKQFQVQLGDQIPVMIDGLRTDLKVVGIYQDISNMGKGFRLSSETLHGINPMFKSSTYALLLEEGIDKVVFEKTLQGRFGESLKVEKGAEQRQEVISLVSGVNTAFLLIAGFFLLFMSIIIFNDQVLELRENETSFNVLKAIGFSRGQIRQGLYVKILVIVLISSFLALPLAHFISPRIMNAFTGGIGLPQFPYLPSFVKTLLLVPLLAMISVLLIRFSSKSINRIKSSLLIS